MPPTKQIYSETVGVPMTPKQKKAVVDAARDDDRSTSSWIRIACAEKLARELPTID